MTVATSPGELASAPSAAAIGVFDGVHRGHQEIVSRAAEAAASQDLRCVAVTFDPHPAAVVRGDPPALLQTVDDRAVALRDAGADAVLVLPFDRELSQLPPRAFAERVLAGSLQAREVVVGRNFRFGAKAAGDPEMLAALGGELGFTAHSVELLGDGDPISSTAIRSQLRDGDVADAAGGLGRPWSFAGEVETGEGRGRTIGVPTANIRQPAGLVRPANGVYACRVQREAASDGPVWDAAVNVGVRPTFEGRHITVEAHLLDADVDVYGDVLRVRFVERIRDERKFDGPDELVTQIRADVSRARELLT